MFAMQLRAHLTHYNVPKLQRLAVRVVAIIPIYCINSFFSVYFQSVAFYFDTLKEICAWIYFCVCVWACM